MAYTTNNNIMEVGDIVVVVRATSHYANEEMIIKSIQYDSDGRRVYLCNPNDGREHSLRFEYREYELRKVELFETKEAMKEKEVVKDVLSTQEGGSHYANKAIQPIEFIEANQLGFCEGNVVKYITRHKEKNGAEDIKKVIQYCKFILAFQYGEQL